MPLLILGYWENVQLWSDGHVGAVDLEAPWFDCSGHGAYFLWPSSPRCSSIPPHNYTSKHTHIHSNSLASAGRTMTCHAGIHTASRSWRTRRRDTKHTQQTKKREEKSTPQRRPPGRGPESIECHRVRGQWVRGVGKHRRIPALCAMPVTSSIPIPRSRRLIVSGEDGGEEDFWEVLCTLLTFRPCQPCDRHRKTPDHGVRATTSHHRSLWTVLIAAVHERSRGAFMSANCVCVRECVFFCWFELRCRSYDSAECNGERHAKRVYWMEMKNKRMETGVRREMVTPFFREGKSTPKIHATGRRRSLVCGARFFGSSFLRGFPCPTLGTVFLQTTFPSNAAVCACSIGERRDISIRCTL